MVNWSKEWPKEPGSYWFFGTRFSNEGIPDKLFYVECWRTANALAFVCGPSFLYPSEAKGLWLQCDLPELPLLIKD